MLLMFVLHLSYFPITRRAYMYGEVLETNNARVDGLSLLDWSSNVLQCISITQRSPHRHRHLHIDTCKATYYHHHHPPPIAGAPHIHIHTLLHTRSTHQRAKKFGAAKHWYLSNKRKFYLLCYISL